MHGAGNEVVKRKYPRHHGTESLGYGVPTMVVRMEESIELEILGAIRELP
jgi:hypothetical protein